MDVKAVKVGTEEVSEPDYFKNQFVTFGQTLADSKIQFSFSSCHGTQNYVIGSPAVEQQAAFACLNRVLQYYITQQTPRSRRDYDTFLRNLLTHVMSMRIARDEYFVNDVNGALDSGTNYLIATPAFEAMKGKICLEIRKQLLVLE